MIDLLEPILRPPWQGVGKKLESIMRKAIYEFHLLEDETKIGVALSGGKDSLTLLILLKALSGRGFPELDIHAFHVAGAFSCGASVSLNYLKNICKKLDVPLTIKESNKTLEELVCYTCSRERRSLLFEAAKEKGFKTIAFGHHRDDNIQTLLLNLLHKAEFAANLPKIHMEHYGVTIIRPLILVSEEGIRAFSKQNHFARITCQCPVGQNSKRKQVDRLIDQMEDVFPNVRSNLSQAARVYGSQKASTP